MRIAVLARLADVAEGPVREALGLMAALGGEMETLLLGAAAPAEIAAVGSVRVGVSPDLDDPDPESAYRAALALLGDAPPRILLLPDGPLFEMVGARLAGHYGMTVLRDVDEVRLEGDAVLARKGAYGGKASVLYSAAGGIVLGLRAGAFAAADAASLPAQAVELGALQAGGRERSAVRDLQGDDLGRAKVVVSGGRGLGSREGYESLRPLAALLGASLGASRAAVDEGWASPAQQVGITGRKVAPELYLAIGISGASQHLSGMSGSRLVIAVNRDDKAPIFAAADIGVVADWYQLWPHLQKALEG